MGVRTPEARLRKVGKTVEIRSLLEKAKSQSALSPKGVVVRMNQLPPQKKKPQHPSPRRKGRRRRNLLLLTLVRLVALVLLGAMMGP